MPFYVASKRREVDCVNDGYQFYMNRYWPSSNHGPTSRTWGKSLGRLQFPYDSQLMNQYTIFNADNPADEYKVVIDRTGENRKHLKATVSKMRNKRKVTIGSAEQDVE